MPAPATNTCTVTLQDAHSHSVVFNSVPAGGATSMQMKLNALASICERQEGSAAADFAAFTQTDSLTAIVTQP